METIDKLVSARLRLQQRYPFFAYLTMYLDFRESEELPTMGVNKNGVLYFNPKFVETLTDKDIMFVLAHEVMHVVFEHVDRKGKREPEVWNIACDIKVNDLLMNNGLTMDKDDYLHSNRNNEFAINGIMIRDTDKKTAEQIYEELYKSLPQMPSVSIDMIDDDEQNQKDKDGKGNGKSKDNNLKGAGGKDEPMYDWKQILVDAFERAKQKGNAPAGIDRFVENLFEPKLKWNILLQKSVAGVIPFESTWRKPNKKGIASGVYLPSTLKNDFLDVFVGIDTSGSIGSEDLKTFVSELVGLLRSNVRITCISADSEIHSVIKLTRFNMNDLLSESFAGGGGTSHIPVFEYAKKHKGKHKMLILFTDGYTDYPDSNDTGCDVVWVIVNNNNFDAPYGKVIYYERD